jgi:hypothetical protein
MKANYSDEKNCLTRGPAHNGFYTSHTWLFDYEKYCEPGYRIPREFESQSSYKKKSNWKKRLKVVGLSRNLEKHIRLFLTPVLTVVIWLLQPVWATYYLLRIALKAILYPNRLLK